MAIIENDPKQPLISKKWLYGSLCVIALILGIYADKDATAAENYPRIDGVNPVTIDRENGDIAVNTDSEANINTDSESGHFEYDYVESEDDED